MIRRLAPMSAVTIVIAIVTAGLTQSGSAAPVAAQEWSDGACADNVGITVVVDFQELGGGVNVRCAPGPASSGLDALDLAGVAWEGTLRFPGFVCRIAGLPTPANDACANTPPADAFWTYWIAPRSGDWCYANVGPASRTPPPGSIEGWSFALDKASADIPPPGFQVPEAVPGQAPKPVNASQCTTPAVSGSPVTTVRPTASSSSTTSTSSSTSTTTSSTTTTSSPSTSVTSPARTSPPTSRSVVGIDGNAVSSTTVVASTSTVAGPTVIAIESESIQPSSTVPAGSGGDDDAEAVTAPAANPRPSLFEAAGAGSIAAPAAELGTVDLSDDRRSDTGFGFSSVLAILAIAGVAAAGVLAARRRNRPLRVET